MDLYIKLATLVITIILLDHNFSIYPFFSVLVYSLRYAEIAHIDLFHCESTEDLT